MKPFAFSARVNNLGVVAAGQPFENLKGFSRKWWQVGARGFGIGNSPHGLHEVDVCPASNGELFVPTSPATD